MNETLFSIKDLILMPIYLLVIFYAANQIKNNRISENPLYKFYTRGLVFKLGGGLLVCIIYIFYYGGGDTIGFFESASLLARLSFVNQEAFFSVLGGNLSNLNLLRFAENDLCCPDYYRDAQSFTVVRIAAPLILVSGFSFFVTTFLFAWLSYAGIWRLFLLFNELFPNMEKKFAISILYMPSVLFWGSAILKDTVTFSAACWMTYCVYMIFIKREQRQRHILYLLIASYVVISIKPYIFVALLPGATIWILYSRIVSIRSGFMRLLVSPFIVAVGIIGSSVVLSSLGSSLGSYSSVDSAISKAVITKNDLTREAYGENSFDIGEIDGSLGNIISKFPVALMAGLFRPFLWDVRNPVMLLSAIENTIMLLLTIRILFSLGPLGMARSISSDPLLIFSFVFAIFFSFSVGLTTANFGALVRYKIPCIPFYMSFLMVLNEQRKRKKTQYIESETSEETESQLIETTNANLAKQ